MVLFPHSPADVNERPFNITLSNTVVDENCPQDTVVGNLLSLDPDRSQTHTYTMVNSAGGRFKLAGKQLKVAMSNVDCLKNGGDFCKLNYEKKGSYTVKVRVTDNGSPRLSSEASMVISLNDVNDRPNDFRLSSRTVKENATVGTKIGRFTATDEDQFQTLTFSLLNSDGGRFAIDSTGYLFKAKKTDYETSKAHKIVAQVTDNGTVPLNVSSLHSDFCKMLLSHAVVKALWKQNQRSQKGYAKKGKSQGDNERSKQNQTNRLKCR